MAWTYDRYGNRLTDANNRIMQVGGSAVYRYDGGGCGKTGFQPVVVGSEGAAKKRRLR